MQPGITNLTSQLVSFKQTTEPTYNKWLEMMKEVNFHNRRWKLLIATSIGLIIKKKN